MTEIQDFKFVLSNSFAVDATIEDHKGHYQAEFITPSYQNGGPRTLMRADGQFSDAKAAFDWIAHETLRYANEFSLSLAWIDNPCNTPFIDKADQVAILSGHGFNGFVLVNSQP